MKDIKDVGVGKRVIYDEHGGQVIYFPIGEGSRKLNDIDRNYQNELKKFINENQEFIPETDENGKELRTTKLINLKHYEGLKITFKLIYGMSPLEEFQEAAKEFDNKGGLETKTIIINEQYFKEGDK